MRFIRTVTAGLLLAVTLAGCSSLQPSETRVTRPATGNQGFLRTQLEQALFNEIILLLPPALPMEKACAIASAARACYGAHVWLGATRSLGAQDALHTLRLRQIAHLSGLPLVAAGDVHMHLRSRRRLQDALSAVRLGKPVRECGRALHPNGERHLRLRARLAQVYPAPLLAAETTTELSREVMFAVAAASFDVGPT